MSSFTAATYADTGRRRAGRRIWRVSAFRFYVGKLGSSEWVDIPEGFETDGPSIPRWLAWVIPGRWLARMIKSATVHDRLREDLDYNLIDCDAQFLVAMKAEGTPALLREAAFLAVRTNTSRVDHNA